MRLVLLFVLLLGGCWDFNALQTGYGQLPDARQPVLDATGPQPDLTPADDLMQPVIMNLFGYGELVLDKADCGAEVQSGQSLYDKPDLKNTCSGCACAQPDKCKSKVAFYSKDMCKAGDLKNSYNLITGNDCTKVTSDIFYRLDAPQLQCQADSSKATVDVGWQHQARLCTTGTGCTTLTCMMQQQPAGKKLCVALKQQNASCPVGLMPANPANWYSYNDTRTCSCQCDNPMGMCDGMAALFTDDMCTMNGSTINMTMCQGTPMPMGNLPKSVQFKWTPHAGQMCMPTGTTMGATPMPADITICCQP